MTAIWNSEQGCIVSRCPDPRSSGEFCERHALAPAVKRAGWTSANRRRKKVSLDASSVAPRLWVGGYPGLDRDIPSVDVLVLCARELQPKVTDQIAFHGRIIRCPLPDAELTVHELNTAVVASGEVALELVRKRHRVLVTCHMGLNRSALVAALALGRITRCSSEQLIALMRARRDPRCLFNDHFQKILHRIVGSGRQR